MSVTPRDVEQVARLAELAVEPEELPELTAQLNRIVGFVARLSQLDSSRPEGEREAEGGERFIPGPDRAPLREDLVRPAQLAIPPARLAPEFIDGFFVVPRLGAMEEEP